MTGREETAYVRGQRQVYASMALTCARELLPAARGKVSSLLAEREAAVNALRDLCEQLGIEADFPPELHLADIISKRIARQLEDKR